MVVTRINLHAEARLEQEQRKARKRETTARWYRENKEHQNQNTKRWYRENKEKHAEMMKQWRLGDPEKAAAINARWYQENKSEIADRVKKKRERDPLRFRMYTYRSTPAEFESFVAQQGNVCRCCGEIPRTGKKGPWRVDHCHVTGAIRGILCHRCNTLLGRWGDAKEGLQKTFEMLKAYLELPVLKEGRKS
jgi:hypothetical protein